MILMILVQMFASLWCILWSFYIKNYLNWMVHIILMHLFTLCFMTSFTAFPLFLDKYKHYKFNKLVKNKGDSINWWNYILLNDTNIQKFARYLAGNKTIQHLLFMVEMMEYKTCIINKLNVTNNGYILSLNNNHQTMITSTSIVNDMLQLGSNEITIQRIKDDLFLLYDKYIENDALFVAFVSSKTRTLILDTLNSVNDIEIINVFDNAMEEISIILQLLYMEYQCT